MPRLDDVTEFRHMTLDDPGGSGDGGGDLRKKPSNKAESLPESDEAAEHEIDAIISRLDAGIARAKGEMSELLEHLRRAA